jgi:hypothetical protein
MGEMVVVLWCQIGTRGTLFIHLVSGKSPLNEGHFALASIQDRQDRQYRRIPLKYLTLKSGKPSRHREIGSECNTDRINNLFFVH